MSVERAKNVPPFVLWCTAMIPTAFDDSMSYYEALCALYKWIQDNIINVVNNNAEVLKEYVKIVEDLKKYVENYFENLDVQEEINNKLDDMAEHGQLAGIIAQFLEVSPVFAYGTVADMSNAENLSNGSIARTLGYSVIGDGKGAFYKIETLASQTIDDNVYIAVGDTLVAHKAVEYGYADTTNPIYYGADPTGTVDSASAINACIQANLGGAVKFTGGKYIVNSAILTPYRTSETVNIDFGGATLYTEAELPYVLGVGYYNIDYSHMPNGDDYSAKSCYGICENFVIDAPNATVGVMTNQNYWYPRLLNFSIFNTVIGIQLGQNRDIRWSSDAAIDNGYIQCKSYADRNTRGIVIYGYDNKIVNCRIYNAFIGIEDKKGGNFFINNHIYIYGNANDRETPEFANLYPDTIAFYANGATNESFESVYFDSYNTAFKYTGENFVGSFHQCFYGTNAIGYDGIGLDFSDGTITSLTVNDTTFAFENASAGGKNTGLKLSASQSMPVLAKGLNLQNIMTYDLNADMLLLDSVVNHTKPFLGSNALSSANYYILGYIPVAEYQSYIVGVIGTSNPSKSLARFWIGQGYTIEANNIGSTGSLYNLGYKVVDISGVKYLEISFKPAADNIPANIGLFIEKDKSCEAIGIIPTVAKTDVFANPANYTTTPNGHLEYDW